MGGLGAQASLRCVIDFRHSELTAGGVVMDLNTELPGPPGIAGRATGRMCCDPALGFADQSVRRAQTITSMQLRSEADGGNAFGWKCPYGSDERNFFEGSACTADMSPGERDRFMEGCLKVQEDERLRLGRELHDSTGQLLLALRLNLARLKRAHGTAVEDELIAEIENTASQIDQEIRSFAFLHYPAEILRDGLSETLRYLVRGFAARTGLKVSFASLGDDTEIRGSSANALLRVAQEALMNVHRHARASHVRVALTLRDRQLTLVVRDDGIGLPPTHDATNSQGVGLPGMRHRVERLGGHFAVKRMKHGTKLIASAPLG